LHASAALIFLRLIRGSKQSYSCSSVVLGVSLGTVVFSVARFREAFLARSFDGLAVLFGEALGVAGADRVAAGDAVVLGETLGIGVAVAVGVALAVGAF
jgi:hypothetical protein